MRARRSILALALASLAGVTAGGLAQATTAPPSSPAAPTVVPDTPAGAALEWVVNDAGAASLAEFTAHLSPTVIDAVGAAEAQAAVLAALDTAGPDGFAIAAVDELDELRLVATLVAGDGSATDVYVEVSAADPSLIEGLQVLPGPLPESPGTADEIAARLAALAPATQLLVSPVGGEPVVEIAPDVVGPIGSAFKLWVLGALVTAIDGGTVAWDDDLTITAEVKSLPSGELQDRPDGSTVSVEEAATLMISISDNTATDLLIDRLGVAAVEQAMVDMGASGEAQTRTLPVLTTRQLFTLKWTQDAAVLDRYAAASAADRQAILAGLPAELPSPAAIDPTVPVHPDTIEWFASPDELAAAMGWLVERIDEPALGPLATILATNPGLELDPAVWTVVAFKGGSEPGVVSMTWWLERADGEPFVVSLIASDPTGPIDESEAVSIVVGAIELVAVQPTGQEPTVS